MKLTRRRKKARNRRVILVVASLIIMVAAVISIVHDTAVSMVPATVVSSCNGVVTMETADGQLWTCYGDTTAAEVTAVFQSGACIDFEEN